MSAHRGEALRRVEEALENHGSRQDGSSMWQCPAQDHDDRKASLSVGQGDKGVVVCCQAGCDLGEEILPALGLTWPDLFDNPHRAGDRLPRRVVGEYRYTDENGELLFVKVRYEPKDFAVRRPDGNGGWIYKLGSVRRVLYRLPEVLAAVRDGRRVFLVEGEKDADRLASIGHVATCNFDGAAKEGQRAKWRGDYGDLLRGAVVDIIADRDRAGEAHARAAAADLAGKATSVRLLQSATTREHDDVSDHLDAGLRLDDLVVFGPQAPSESTVSPAVRNWECPDPDAYDPAHPAGLLEIAAKACEAERAKIAIWAVRSIAASQADPYVLTVVGRDYVKRAGLMPLESYDDLVRRFLAERGRGEESECDRAPSVATQLVEIAQEMFAFGVSDLGEPFALPASGPKVVSMLRGSKTSLRALLAREFFARAGKAATQQALADALLVLEGVAQQTDPQTLYLRVAQHDGSLWLDLGDQTGRAVEINSGGWAIHEQPPVLFKRTSLTGALPEPQHGGEVADLWDWLNVSKDDQPLILAALVHALFSDEPHVVLAILGEQGTAKTTAAKILVLLLDPGPVPVRKPPRDAEAWVTAASGSWMVALDNLSDIPPWLSDAMCRASTGEGDVRRKLYTDGDFAVFAFKRCILFDGIDVGALAPDLAERAVPVVLDLIPDEKRKPEKAFWRGWPAAHPKLLGALLDLAVTVLANPAPAERSPRMADYAEVLGAVDAELGTNARERYARQSAALAADSLSSDPFAVRVQAIVTDHFEGTSAELLDRATPKDPEWHAPKDWPTKPRQVTSWLRRLAPAFRKTGWKIEDLGSENHAKLLRWSISPPAQSEKAGDDTGASTSAERGGNLCAKCGRDPAGPGGVLCSACKSALQHPGEAARKDPRQSPREQVCPDCGSPKDSILHAVNCLGQEGDPPCHHEECWDALTGRCLKVVAS